MIERQLEAAAGGVRPGARLVQDDGAVLRLRWLQANCDRERIRPDKRSGGVMNHAAVAGEAKGGRRSLVHDREPVLHLGVRLHDAVRRRIDCHPVELEMRDRRGPIDGRRRQPGGEGCARIAGDHRQPGFRLGDTAHGQVMLPLGARRPQEERWRRRGVREVRVEAGFVDVVEERKERVVVALRDRVELVVVTARALERQAEHRGAEGVDAVEDVLGAELLLDAAAFVGLAVQAVERRGDALVARRVGQEIARELPEEELVVGQVLVEGADDPVAIRRHVAIEVGLVAVGVGVAGKIEPVHRHALAVGRRRKIAIDGARVGVRRSIGEKRVDLGWRGRQAREVERQAAQQNLGRGLRSGLQAFLDQPRAHERVDGGRRTRWRRHRRKLVHRDERPVRLVVGPLGDPAAQQRLLGVRQRQVRVGRRHHVVFEVREDAPDELALLRNARLDDRPPVVDVLERPVARIEAQLGLPLRGVGPVTAKAAVRQQRADLEAEVDADPARASLVARSGWCGQAWSGRRARRPSSARKSKPGAHTRRILRRAHPVVKPWSFAVFAASRTSWRFPSSWDER